MPKAVALYDSVRWTDADGAIHEFAKGEEQDLPQSEYDRLANLDPPAVSKPSSGDAKDARAQASESGGQ